MTEKELQSIMTEKDLQLIEEAKKAREWYFINESEAESEEAREILHNLKTSLYHREEAECGIL